MRHELPLPRRLSVQSQDTPTRSPGRPLSSSFFATIDPLTPARHSSLHLYPQHIFPSKLNNLEKTLQGPYAFSHQSAAFYWTRDDALANHKLNIWAKPPCLNCELAGEDYARRCDRYKRQEDSLGQIHSCSRCERVGQSDSCVEQIEIRADGKYGEVVEGKGIMHQISQHSTEERNLRSVGLVWWMPINLETGDIDKKNKLLIQRREQKMRPRALPVEGIDSNRVKWIEKCVSKHKFKEKIRIQKEMNQQRVTDWGEEDLSLEPLLLCFQVKEADAPATVRMLNRADSKSAVEERAAKLGSDKLYWSTRIRAERDELYLKEVAELGMSVADTLQAAWDSVESDILSVACRFLERKSAYMGSSTSEEEVIAFSRKGLEQEVIGQLDELVPQMFCRSV